MAKQLRLNLDSAEAREFLIQKILSSYEKALFVLKSTGQPQAAPLPESNLLNSSTSTDSLLNSSTSTDSPQNREFEFDFDFDQNVVSKKRKTSTCEDSTRFGFNDDDFEPLNFPNHFDDELLLQGYSSTFISPATSESNYFTDWTNSPSLDFDLEPIFIFNDSLF
ncbi:hypothetical protein L2E82_06486 [Cichorium intybus]|uniref:Uncharacterized protein n=1 Tax=Cichorium intybus TaxID=13427 RepID=A0ACB9HBA0_CICIN|nr:hypothetical protein L2E82_06486 [Cichorium intybus]